MFPRFIEKFILKELKPGLVVGLFGPRRSGKTILMNQIKDTIKDRRVLLVSGEDLDTAEPLSSQRTSVFRRFLAGYDFLFIDEAQKIPHIGENLKLMIDTFPRIGIFITGSSSFNLREQVGEPLLGRSRYFHLYPLSQIELKEHEDYLTTQQNLEERLLFGAYPEILTIADFEGKIAGLIRLRDGYLLKDVLTADNIKDSLFVFNLLRLIAFQIGKDISYSELAYNLNVDKKTVMRYLELLEKSFVIFSLSGYSRNLRKEYTRTPRYFFWDNGVRNALISNFNNITSRDDIGQLWENYCVSERLKKNAYLRNYANRFFWRTYDQQEIDYLEEKDGRLLAFEFKWGRPGRQNPPNVFSQTYPNSKFQIVNRENYLDFLA